jgi:hypothetical protein
MEGLVADIGEMRMRTKFSLKTWRPLKRQDVEGRMILKLIFQKSVVRIWTAFDWGPIWCSGGLL